MPHRSARPRRSLRHRSVRLESLEARRLLAADFGDAPAPYPTLLSENGARHEATGPTLGATRDSEANGVHSAAADGDGADEDGVTFGTIRVGQLGATVTVNVQGGAAKLDAWIDFNGDGTWGGLNEQIFAARSVATGDNQLKFDVPSFAKVGTAFARFRLSTSGGLGPKGAAVDGEVEDHMVAIQPAVLAKGAFSGQKTITTEADRTFSVYAADVDGDGDLDVLSASYSDDKIAWYENDGSGEFTSWTISNSSATANGPRSVFAADMDGDGDIDVLSGSYLDGKINWYENNGTQSFTVRNVVTFSTGSGFTQVVAADMDGDGDMDVVASSNRVDKVVWFENNGSQSFTPHRIASFNSTARGVNVADVDGDGDLDVIATLVNSSTIAWYDNDGNQNFTARTVSTTFESANGVTTADMDGDGDLDVIGGSVKNSGSIPLGKVSWFENDGTPSNGGWIEHVVNTNAVSAWSVYAADLDGDGDADLFSAGTNHMVLFENDGTQNFSERLLSTAVDGFRSVVAGDVDGDGDLDVLFASAYRDKIGWFEHFALPVLAANNGATAIQGGRAIVRNAKLAVTDTDTTALQLVYTVTTPPVHGQLELTTNPGVAITSFTQADINAERLLYQHDGSDPAADSLEFTVSDGAGGTIPATTFNISVTAVNEAMQFVSTALTAADEDTEYVYNVITSNGDGEHLAITANNLPSWLTLVDHGNGTATLSGTPTNSEVGQYNIVLKASEGVEAAIQQAFVLTVANTNDAPVLNATLNPRLTTIAEDTTSPASTLVSSLLAGAVSDVDAGAVSGIAVTGASNFNGTWQFSLDAGGTWQGIGAPTSEAARLLPSTARVQFLPKSNFNGTVKLFYRAWDQTQGAAGQTLTTSGNIGGTQSLSEQSGSAALTVTAVNDAPVLNSTFDPLLNSIKEDNRTSSGTQVAKLLGGVTDPDGSIVAKGMAVYNAWAGNGQWEFKLSGTSPWQAMGAVSGTFARLLPAEAYVRFLPKQDFHGTAKFYFRAWDRTQGAAGEFFDPTGNTGGTKSFSTKTDYASIAVTPVTDAPKLGLSGSLNYGRDKLPVTLAPSATVKDVDSPNFAGGRLRVWITDGASSANRLVIGGGFFVDGNNNVWAGPIGTGQIIGKRASNGFGTKELVITFNSSAKPLVVQNLVRAIAFKTVGGSAGKRTINFTVSDGDGGTSNVATKTVNVT